MNSFFEVRYIYSACILISTRDIKLLCDPWLINNAYSGTWTQHPPVTEEHLSNLDFSHVYISHIHPDHYCPGSLRRLFSKYGEKPILIAQWDGNRRYLAKKLIADGFGHLMTELDLQVFGKTSVRILSNDTLSSSDVDSALIVSLAGAKNAVLNLNDCILNPALVEGIRSYLRLISCDIGLTCLGFTGAGSYPQTYFSIRENESELIEASLIKKQKFIERYRSAMSELTSIHRLPFAGKYALQGPLAVLNSYRGVADPLDMCDIDDKAIVLKNTSASYYDVINSIVHDQRSEPETVPSTLNPEFKYDWEHPINDRASKSTLQRLLTKAISNASRRSECVDDCIWSIRILSCTFKSALHLSDNDLAVNSIELVTFNCNSRSDDPYQIPANPRVKADMYIHKNALLSALLGIDHWNNLDIGCSFLVRRSPDAYIREMYDFLNFLTVL